MTDQQQPHTTYLKDYRPSDFLIDDVNLFVELHENVARVKSLLTIRRNPLISDRHSSLVLDGEELNLESIILAGNPLSKKEYEITETQLIIANVPDQFTLETVVSIHPEKNTRLSGLYQSRENYCTQCESHGFRRITYYIDRPDVMSRFTTTISADKARYPYLLSNGNLIDQKDLSSNRHQATWQDPSLKPCYLFALVAGDFDVLSDQYTTLSGRAVQLHLYLEKGFKEQGGYALESLKRAMCWDEKKFGREYDLNIYMIVAVSDFNFGAMENKGLNIFNTKYILAQSDTATDADYVAIEGVIGHEYFHNWTGNRITLRDWFQLTLKEGLTVLRDQWFTEDMTSRALSRLEVVNSLRNQQFPEDAGPMAHPIRPDSYIEITNFYTQTVYRKGAEVIRMLATLLGQELFRRGMDYYFESYDGQAVTTEDFVKAMEKASGRDFTQFKHWYDQAGTPVLHIQSDYDEKAKTFRLMVEQTCPPTPGQAEKKPFHLPLAIGLVGSVSQQDIIGTRVLEITEHHHEFTFIHVLEKPIPSLLRHFSAPVKLEYAYTDDELLSLLLCDSDPFARWEAGQLFLTQLILRLADEHQMGGSLNMDDRLIATYSRLLKQETSDHGLLGELLVLPSMKYLLQQKTKSEVESIYAAREFVISKLAAALRADWQKIYQSMSIGRYQYNPVDAGKRRLKNISLSYLVNLGTQEQIALAYQQFQKTDNMTDKMGALHALNDKACPERERALNAFYEEYQHQPLVVNKWLSLQASSSLPDTLENIKKLLIHPAVNLRNPNDVYALLVTLGNNMIVLHQKDGSVYQFLADQIIQLDAINPQVAARVLQPLTQFSHLDAHRQQLIRGELSRIAAQPKLSKDVYEVVTKSLS